MKTIFINCSPKKRFCASAYFLGLQRFFVKGEKVTEKLRNQSDHQRILHELADADAVVFCLPLYVDSVPSHVLSFLKEMELFCKENNIRLHVYSISNNGFIEGKQSEPLLRVFRNFCAKSNLEWGGGIGIGGGVMLNVTRIVFVIQVAILFLNILLNGIQNGNFLPMDALANFAEQAAALIFLNLGVFFYIIRMGGAINRKKFFGKKYTRIMVPSFVFILFADIFFIIISVFQGGIFRGWLAKKQPD
ncbi:MAG: hypothetical protein NC094_11270 [Bacteroidales bacterium]|nr:hypothetical protein [Lachnoclostridium sp.]MCM1385354.1 hypothetical protein [Lachnoclostridium sp.]MCM1465988.1 hypothetical protein [Bacteroidales bacterium]